MTAKKIYSDPRLLAAMIRRTALTPTRRLGQSTPAPIVSRIYPRKMEDRACDWVTAAGDTLLL